MGLASWQARKQLQGYRWGGRHSWWLTHWVYNGSEGTGAHSVPGGTLRATVTGGPWETNLGVRESGHWCVEEAWGMGCPYREGPGKVTPGPQWGLKASRDSMCWARGWPEHRSMASLNALLTHPLCHSLESAGELFPPVVSLQRPLLRRLSISLTVKERQKGVCPHPRAGIEG